MHKNDSMDCYRIRASMAKPHGYPSKRCYGAHRPRCPCDRIKIAPVKLKTQRINDKTAQDDETTYLGHAHIAQPPVNRSKRSHRVVGPRCRCGRNKIGPVKLEIKHINDKPAQENKTAYHGRAQAMQPCGNPSKGCWEVHRTRRRRGVTHQTRLVQ